MDSSLNELGVAPYRYSGWEENRREIRKWSGGARDRECRPASEAESGGNAARANRAGRSWPASAVRTTLLLWPCRLGRDGRGGLGVQIRSWEQRANRTMSVGNQNFEEVWDPLVGSESEKNHAVIQA